MNASTDLVARWDAQQAAYIAERELRFDTMIDVLELGLSEEITVIDLACGPGSLSARVLDRLPQARVISIDIDPVLLALAERHLARFGDRARVVEADLADASWSDVLDGPADAAVSTTALHWFSASQIVKLYGEVAGALRPGGIFLDGDHFRFDDRTPQVRGWAAAHDERTQQRSFAAGADTWEAWWADVAADPELAPLIARREAVFAGRPPNKETAVDLRLAALAQAGFAESGTLWQLLDDYIVYGVR